MTHGPGAALERREDAVILARELALLPPGYSHVLTLHYLVGMDYPTMAQQLMVPVTTARTRIHRSLKLLRARLGDCGMMLSLDVVTGLLGQLSAHAATVTAVPAATSTLLTSASVPTTTLHVPSILFASIPTGKLIMGIALSLSCIAVVLGISAVPAHAAKPDLPTPVAVAAAVAEVPVVVPPPPEPRGDAITQVVDQAIAMGFPDARGAVVFFGTMVVSVRSGSGDASSSFTGFHVHLSDGSWMVQMVYPLTPAPGLAIDTSDLQACELSKRSDFHLSPTHDAQYNHIIFYGRMMGFLPTDLVRFAYSFDPAQQAPQGHTEYHDTHLCRLAQWSDICAGFGAMSACGVSMLPGVPGDKKLADSFDPDSLRASYATTLGPGSSLGLCAEPVWAKISRGEMPLETKLRYALAYWFELNLRGLPAPFHGLTQEKAWAGAAAMLPGDDAVARVELAVVRAGAAQPDSVLPPMSLAQRLLSWRSYGGWDINVERISLMHDPGDPEAYTNYFIRRHTTFKREMLAMLALYAAALDESRFTVADLPQLMALIGDTRASRWMDQGHPRTIGDQALRAVSTILELDPRWLVGHDPGAVWTEQERSGVVGALTAWWTAHDHDSLEEIRAAALPLMDATSVAYLVEKIPKQEVVPLLDDLARVWRTGPPATFKDQGLLAYAALSPAFQRTIAQWPITEKLRPLLILWHGTHGDRAPLISYLETLLAPATTAAGATVIDQAHLATALALLCCTPDTANVERLQQVLAGDPTSRSTIALMSACMNDNWSVSLRVDQTAFTSNRDALLLAFLAQMLQDQRPAPTQAVDWPIGSDRKNAPTDLRVTDYAAIRIQELIMRWGGKPAPTEAHGFDLLAARAQRDAGILLMSNSVRKTLPAFLSKANLTVSIPGYDLNPTGAVIDL